MGEAAAAHLREQILSGDLLDGGELPTQQSLVDALQLSRQAVREGLHILELERLITIRRGNVGGAVVHRPSPTDAAYNFALVTQARGARLHDVGAALTKIEPICVGLCARRPDRSETVVPRLRAARHASAATIRDPSAWIDAQSLFHRILASDCGNEALAIVAGALEAVWMAHVRVWAEGRARAGEFPDVATELECPGVGEHDTIITLIEQGDAERAVRVARDHMEVFYAQLSGLDAVITATTLTDGFN